MADQKGKKNDNDDCLAMHGVFHTFDRISERYYRRIVVNNEVINSESCTRTIRRNSYTVVLNDDSLFSVKTFLMLHTGTDNTCYAIGQYFNKTKHSFFSSQPNPFYFIPVMRCLGHLTAIPASSIKGKCVFLSTPHLPVKYILRFVNSVEMMF